MIIVGIGIGIVIGTANGASTATTMIATVAIATAANNLEKRSGWEERRSATN